MKHIIAAVLSLGIASCAVDNDPVSTPAPDDDAVTEATTSSDISAAPASTCGFFVCLPLAQCQAIEGAVSHPQTGCNGTRTCCEL